MDGTLANKNTYFNKTPIKVLKAVRMFMDSQIHVSLYCV